MAHNQMKSCGLFFLVLILVAIGMVFNNELKLAEAAKIETFNGASCSGNPTNTFYVGGNTCQKFSDQGAVRITDVSSSTRISVHNQKDCETYSSVAQVYGPDHCVVKGQTYLRAVWIQG